MTDLPALIERLDHLAEHIGDDDYHLPLMSKSAVLLAVKALRDLPDDPEKIRDALAFYHDHDCGGDA